MRKRPHKKYRPGDALFDKSSPSLVGLHKQARGELRLKARARWLALQQAQQQAIANGQKPDYNEE